MTTTTTPDVRALCAAAEAGDLDTVGAILEASPALAHQDTASSDEHQAIHFAVYGDQPGVVRVLLEAGADPLNGIYPHREATSALTMARDRGLDGIVEVIEGWLAQTRGTTSAGQELSEAASRGDAERVRELLDGDSELVRATDRRGQTALHRAVGRGDLVLSGELIDRGADVDRQDATGSRPLQQVLFHSWKEPDEAYPRFTAVAGLLLGRGARYDLWAAAGLAMSRRCEPGSRRRVT